MNYVQLALETAAHIRSVVRPLIGTVESGRVTGAGQSGDARFSIDEAAEEAVVEFIRKRNLNLAYYTEDAGLRTFTSPEAVLIIDPIDGSRGAKCGFECCTVSVAVAEYKENPRLKDVRAGCVYEIKEDRAFAAGRHRGITIIEGQTELPARRSNVDRIEQAAWTAEFAGRPSELTAQALSGAIDASSIHGGFFVFTSTAYSLTRLATGQLSAVVDIGGRLLRDLPRARQRFVTAGCGTVVGLFPYDFAAAVLVAEEAGCVVTDAYGRSLDNVELLDSSERSIHSLIAACTPALHEQFLNSVSRGFARLLV